MLLLFCQAYKWAITGWYLAAGYRADATLRSVSGALKRQQSAIPLNLTSDLDERWWHINPPLLCSFDRR